MRPDVSDKLIHFTRGLDDEAAYQRLRSIITSGHLIGSRYKSKNPRVFVSFTEAPPAALVRGLRSPRGSSRYSAFGLMFEKVDIFQAGGRPVIYQPDEEYELLLDALKWRHVRYEPPTTDFSWEREWRLPAEKHAIHPTSAAIVVPDDRWLERLQQDQAADDHFRLQEYGLVLGATIAELYRESIQWNVVTLDN